MEAEEVFAAYELDMRSRKKSRSSHRQYALATTQFTAFLRSNHISLGELRRPNVQQYFLERGIAPSSQRTELAWIRAAWRYAMEELEALDRPFPRVKLEEVPKREPKTIKNATLRKMKEEIQDKETWALFHLLAYTGARRFEIGSLKWEDVSFGDMSIRIAEGKGNKERRIPLHPELAKALRGLGVYQKASPWVLPGVRGNECSPTTVSDRTRRMAGRFGHSAHDFRRTVASSLENNDAREAAIFQIMGWSADNSLRLRNYTSISMRRLYLEILKLYQDDPI